MNCARCGNHLVGRQTRFCSIACKNVVAVTEWRRRTKLRGVKYLGGKCARCGYDKNRGSLIFHHPGKKSFSISSDGNTRSWAKVKAELDKCVLLCLNCHGEEHNEHLDM